MPAFTPALNLYKPGGGSSGLILPDEVVDIDRLNSNSDLIDAYAAGWGQASARNHQFYGPVSGMAGITGMKRGDTYKESDGNFKLWEYNGSNWVSGESGMYRIFPTLVPITGASVSGAAVVLANVTGTVTLTGLFSPRFDRYLIDISIDNATVPTSANVFLAVRTTGGPITTGYYGAIVEFSSTSAITKYETTNGPNFPCGRYTSNGASVQLEIIRPTKATGTNKQFISKSIDGTNMHHQSGGDVDTASVLDGVDLNFPAQVHNGRIKVYGFA